MKKGFCLAALSALALSGCAFPVDEGYFFKPQAVEKKATDPSQMRINGEEKVTGPFSDDKFLEGRSPLLVGHLPAKIRHDFVALGGERIAVSRVTSAKSDGTEPLILYCGGNSGDRIRSGLNFVDKVLPWGEVVMFDYPGYGDSTGEATMKFMTPVQEEMPAYIDGLAKGRPLVFWGHSLGGLICPEIARLSTEVDAMLIETSAPSSLALANTRKPGIVSFVSLDLVEGLEDYNTPKALGSFDGPILVLGAGKDAVIPVQQARNLADQLKAAGRKVEYREYAQASHSSSAMNSAFAKDGLAFFETVTDLRH
jgi:pimeloyl-ACP methyl ester carboxylesterase